MKNYTLDEIKKELFKEIEELEEKDSFWKKCNNCPFKGKCCIDNDIDIREDEWIKIKNLLNNDDQIRAQVKENFRKNRKCYFRTDKCCLIHDIRPTNCIYTPYQAVITKYEGHLIYNRTDEDCNFRRIEKEGYKPSEETILKITGEEHPYLLLNHWVDKYESQSIDGYKMLGEERLREYFNQKHLSRIPSDKTE